MNKLSKQAWVNIISIIAIVVVAYFTSHALLTLGAIITNSFGTLFFNLPVVISGASLYFLLMFYLKDAYIRYIPLKRRIIELGINALFNLIAIVLYLVNINAFISNLMNTLSIQELFLFIFAIAMLTFDILSIVFTLKGKYNEEFFKDNRYFAKTNTPDFVLLIVFGLFASYALIAIIYQLIAIRNISNSPFGYIFLLLALIMSVISFITIIIDKAKNIPVLKIIVTSFNFFAIILMFAYEIIEPGYFVQVAKPIGFIDFAISIPVLFYLLFIDLVAKMVFIVQQSIKK